MTAVRVFVATTVGPSEVQAIVSEDAPKSVICLDGTTEKLPVSRAYDEFVAKGTGIVAQMFGGTSYRVDVARSRLHAL